MSTTKLEDVLRGERAWPPPIWLMRQAGRYLPEYRKVRAEAGSFLDLCHNPKLAAEVTLQPIRRFGFDAAIIFADILLVAAAIGQDLRFAEGEGPVLAPPLASGGLAGLDVEGAQEKLAPISETLRRVRRELDPDVALIGFCGAPWTVATYMAAGRASADHHEARLWAYRDPEGFQVLIDMLVEVSIGYLIAQARSGAGVLKIFDSWAGVLPEMEFDRWVIRPTKQIVAAVRSEVPEALIVGFARGGGGNLVKYATETGVDGVALDTMTTGAAGRGLQSSVAVQGNVDPLALLAGGPRLGEAVTKALGDFGAGRYVFNLGHGIHKDTPPGHVAELVRLVREAPDRAP